jgi:cysteine sulfinate desulfinase/cysteine desulfurase-like protein
MVTVMHANNEVGAVQPLAEISAAVKKWAYECKRETQTQTQTQTRI